MRGGTIPIYRDLEDLLGPMLISVWSMDDMKTTLRYHVHVSKYAGGKAVFITTPGLILPVIGWALGRRMVISHSRLILP